MDITNRKRKMLVNCLVLLSIGLSKAAFIARPGSSLIRSAACQRHRVYCTDFGNDNNAGTPSGSTGSKSKNNSSNQMVEGRKGMKPSKPVQESPKATPNAQPKIVTKKYYNAIEKVKAAPTIKSLTITEFNEDLLKCVDAAIKKDHRVLYELLEKYDGDQDAVYTIRGHFLMRLGPDSASNYLKINKDYIDQFGTSNPLLFNGVAYLFGWNLHPPTENESNASAGKIKRSKSITITEFNQDILKCVDAGKKQDYEVLRGLLDKYAGDRDAIYTFRGHFFMNLGVDDINYLNTVKMFIDQYGTTNPLLFNGDAYLLGLELGPSALIPPSKE